MNQISDIYILSFERVQKLQCNEYAKRDAIVENKNHNLHHLLFYLWLSRHKFMHSTYVLRRPYCCQTEFSFLFRFKCWSVIIWCTFHTTYLWKQNRLFLDRKEWKFYVLISLSIKHSKHVLAAVRHFVGGRPTTFK
jgi:hypothetical protein